MFSRYTKTIAGIPRPGFTLVELMVSIAIIGVMVGMVLYTLAGAQQDALRNRTRGTITKINSIILERWEGYRYRSVKLPISQELIRKRVIGPRQVAQLRAIFLNDMMRMEMPDRQSDLWYTPTDFTVALTDNSPYTLQGAPGREYNILRNYFNLTTVAEPYPSATENKTLLRPLNAARKAWSDTNQSAECLYAIVAHSTSGGGSALEGFHTSEIADTDGDGYPEFIDAWGRPISWIRWPAAFPSQLNLSYKGTDPANPASPDAFDPLRTGPQWSLPQKPWTLVPLIFSGGSDEEYGIYANNGNPMENDPGAAFAVTHTSYFMDPQTGEFTEGSVLDAALVTDNVTNHDLLLQ